ncbi:MAG: AMP-binding protein [Acidobacteriota bacterium]|nr:AMP-binding protein [Acidobacteriota bacterium]
MNLDQLFAVARLRRPDKPALRVREQDCFREVSYGELFERARQIAVELAVRGLWRGDRIAFFLGNRVEFVTAYLAAIKLGAVMVPINLAYRRREIEHILEDAAPCLLLTERDQLPVLEEIVRGGAGRRGSLPEVVLAEDLAGWPAGPVPPGEGVSGSAASGPLAVAAPAGGDDLAAILYTSGTTGRSKGAMLTHNNLMATVTALLAAWGFLPDDVLLLCLPLFHVHGLVVGLHCALAVGATVHLERRFEAAAVVEALGGGLPTLFFGVPTLYVRLIEALRREGAPRAFAGMRLFCSGSAPLPAEVFTAFRELTGHTILERYGMTEAGMILSNPYAGPRRPGEVGTPLPGVSVRVVDGAGRDTAPAEAGELLVRGGNVFAGYWQAPDKTASSFTQDELGRRWFRTGDLARQDPATGSFTLLGRSRELIISGGFNVYPREVEETLTAFAGIREAAVVGRPHPEWGEVPVAFLVSDGPVDEAALVDFCKGQLAGFKVPRLFRYLDALPRNALGKVQKQLLPAETERDD